jgi:hypothetical protein
MVPKWHPIIKEILKFEGEAQSMMDRMQGRAKRDTMKTC